MKKTLMMSMQTKESSCLSSNFLLQTRISSKKTKMKKTCLISTHRAPTISRNKDLALSSITSNKASTRKTLCLPFQASTPKESTAIYLTKRPPKNDGELIIKIELLVGFWGFGEQYVTERRHPKTSYVLLDLELTLVDDNSWHSLGLWDVCGEFAAHRHSHRNRKESCDPPSALFQVWNHIPVLLALRP